MCIIFFYFLSYLTRIFQYDVHKDENIESPSFGQSKILPSKMKDECITQDDNDNDVDDMEIVTG